MTCCVAQQWKCQFSVTGSYVGFHSPPLQHWKRVNSLRGARRKTCCLHENARKKSIQKTFSKTQGLAASSGTIQATLVTRARLICSKLFKIYFQYYKHNSYSSSILVIAIKTRHLLNLNLMLLTGYLAF